MRAVGDTGTVKRRPRSIFGANGLPLDTVDTINESPPAGIASRIVSAIRFLSTTM